MTTFVVSKENNIDIWKKVMYCFRAVYMQAQEAIKHDQQKNVLQKNDIIILASILSEVGNSDASVWSMLQQDILSLMEMEATTFTKVQREEAYNQFSQRLQEYPLISFDLNFYS
jgi:hypothetical protein